MSLKAWFCLLLVVFVAFPVGAALHVPVSGHWALVIGNTDYSEVIEVLGRDRSACRVAEITYTIQEKDYVRPK